MTTFVAARWLSRWMKVGSIQVEAGRVRLVLDLDGNQSAQRSLLAQLDAPERRGRRDMVRDVALERWKGP